MGLRAIPFHNQALPHTEEICGGFGIGYKSSLHRFIILQSHG